ncbi:hypothetical protein LOTGIDRAFT_172688 [Lottia gigantea]|uniref:Alpha-1,3-mannosyl-glycoprotein 4-beta-N-acetylglucosaminyltransferase C n=1 Tax=Lottia gigantea TaxID=225164 RepID=V4CHC5_LOTGI|nr:hypothetical protein LOTGIDRAFT_172688 [Lottia gigantea]ESP01515.1 hypothetical protein LOTGIDRAFT_172688 [Lottia gigantea]
MTSPNVSNEVNIPNSTIGSEKSGSQPLSSISHAIQILSYFLQNFRCKYDCTVDMKESEMFQAKPRKDVFLTIGIPTVLRSKSSYLNSTLTSLISALTPQEHDEVLILVFLADFNKTDKYHLAKDLNKSFGKYIRSGLIRVIQAPKTFYPKDKIKRLTYDQSKRYVNWRSKQCYDFAYMFKYASNLSQYYMQIEDDVSTGVGFLKNVKSYMDSRKDWICLEFSELGFIGKLYRTEHLERLAILMMMFYSEQPVDVTYLYFNRLMVQYGRNLQIPTLFQHNGLYSSLNGKLQRLKDRFYIHDLKVLKGDNPPADVFTNMAVYMDMGPKFAYSASDGIFWSHGAQKSGDTLTVIFQKPQKLKRVAVLTGGKNAPKDKIYNGRVEVSLTLLNNSNSHECTNNIQIGNFVDGVMDNGDLGSIVKFKVMCVVITVTKNMDPWIIIREIAVFTS